jgi:hypothetical protein
MQSKPYDQRWISLGSDGYQSKTPAVSLCSVCGIANGCVPRKALALLRTKGVITHVDRCHPYVPVISFKDETGLSEPTWNTFRRGTAWSRRAPVGTPIRCWVTDAETLFTSGHVIESVTGQLGVLLERHAAMNHALIAGNYADASQRLGKTLIRLYGKNYASPESVYSVIYVQRKDT